MISPYMYVNDRMPHKTADFKQGVTMSFAEARKFLLASYHDLPNILFVGSLILGALMGYLPLIWMAVGLIFNATVISFLQVVLGVIYTKSADRTRLFGDSSVVSPACFVGFGRMKGADDNLFGVPVGADRILTPSHWIGAATFFAVFSIYNSARLIGRDSVKGADVEKVGARRAFSLSALVIGLVFLGLVLMRAFTGCETAWSGAAGFLVSGALSIAFWHILDACGSGKVPDLLQVVGSLAPDSVATDSTVPIVCTPPPEED